MTREEAIKKIKWFREYNEDDFGGGDRIQDKFGDWYYLVTEQDFEAFDMAIKALEQEPTDKNFTKADIDAIVKAINKGWELRVNEILSKIRAEIETKYGQCDICEYFEDYDYEENDISEYRPIGNIADILQIIDKYKTESERKE
jgi:hypothetical protein